MLRLLLFPFALAYDIVTSIRNRLYDMGYKPAAEFEIPVIGVGNLAIGGTGKTPMVEYLIRLLSSQYHLATLSRGYGRATKGFRIATASDNSDTVGDEPYQFYKKFSPRVVVAVGEERALAIPFIIDEHPEVEVILMDDAYQHRRVKPMFQILLTDCARPFYDDVLLPAGRLRESRKGVMRADVIVVTKCPADITEDSMIEMEKSIRDYADKPIFFAKVSYGNLIAIDHDGAPAERVVLLSGIANHKPLEHYVRNNFQLVKHFSFPDHHPYTASELRSVCDTAIAEKAIVLTTEKDAVRLDAETFRPLLSSVPFFYLPIQMEFLKSGKDFDEMILTVLQQHASAKS